MANPASEPTRDWTGVIRAFRHLPYEPDTSLPPDESGWVRGARVPESARPLGHRIADKHLRGFAPQAGFVSDLERANDTLNIFYDGECLSGEEHPGAVVLSGLGSIDDETWKQMYVINRLQPDDYKIEDGSGCLDVAPALVYASGFAALASLTHAIVCSGKAGNPIERAVAISHSPILGMVPVAADMLYSPRASAGSTGYRELDKGEGIELAYEVNLDRRDPFTVTRIRRLLVPAG